MAVRTDKLASGRLVATVPALSTAVYVCPAGRTAIVKTIALWCPTVAVTPPVQLDPLSTISVTIWRPALGANDPQRLETWQVLQPGERLLINQPANAGEIRYWISGTELDGVAPA